MKELRPELEVRLKHLEGCLGKLPERVATVFMMREMDDIESKEICATLAISDNNLWVMLHRARLGLRDCLAVNWFEKSGSAR